MRCLRIFAPILLLLATRAYTQQPSSCPVPQSPRNVNTDKDKGVEYNFVSTKPFITNAKEPDTIEFRGQTLYRCDQHYHVPVENTQGIPNERVIKPPAPPSPPPAGQWIEVHTVYAAKVSTADECKNRLDHDLTCCAEPPFVVRGFSAKVVADGQPSSNPITPPQGTIFAEWSGSNTGPDKPKEQGCKPTAAQWSFLMGDKFTVTQGELHAFPKPHEAREVQGCNLISPNLTLVGAQVSELDEKTCRWFNAGLIRNDEEAKNKCSWTCSSRAVLTRWSGKWQTTKPNEMSQCLCCPPPRPEQQSGGYK